MHRPTPAECDPGDWIPMMEAPEEWEAADSPVSWQAPGGEAWHFAFTAVPTFDPEMGEEVGTEFVWMRFETTAPPPPAGPAAFRMREPQDPADWWKSE